MGFKVKGIGHVIRRMEAVKRAVRREAARANDRMGIRLLEETKDRVDHDFQEVVSYVFESILGLPGTKPQFAEKDEAGNWLVGKFAQPPRTDPLEEPWTYQVQKYRKGAHPLRDKLAKESTEKAQGFFVTKVGYPRHVGKKGTNTFFIIWVLFGTEKMQARPFLTLTLNEYADNFLAEVEKGISKAISPYARQ
jgi:hypothetical protein